MHTIKEALINFCRDFFPSISIQQEPVKDEDNPHHDLGHASKCVWELDKEA